MSVSLSARQRMEAITKIDEEQPDIVIMDINIPIINGLKVIQLSRVKYPSIDRKSVV